ncbi:hypothetical protein KUV89_03305 [Marinobacter hydrocarbonoclasticus]|nr:hypothetical protein [Marinobacter nauticus]
MKQDPFSARERAPFSLMRIHVSFELAEKHVAGVERALSAYVDHPEVQTEIVTSGYEDGIFELELVYFSTTGRYRTELAWLHKAVQSVIVPVPVFTVQIRED